MEEGLLAEARSILGLWDVKNNWVKNHILIKLIPSTEVVKRGIQNTPLASSIEITYKFASSPTLRERYLRADKRGIRFGKMIEEMDALVGDCCYKYMVRDQKDIESIKSCYGGGPGA